MQHIRWLAAHVDPCDMEAPVCPSSSQLSPLTRFIHHSAVNRVVGGGYLGGFSEIHYALDHLEMTFIR